MGRYVLTTIGVGEGGADVGSDGGAGGKDRDCASAVHSGNENGQIQCCQLAGEESESGGLLGSANS